MSQKAGLNGTDLSAMSQQANAHLNLNFLHKTTQHWTFFQSWTLALCYSNWAHNWNDHNYSMWIIQWFVRKRKKLNSTNVFSGGWHNWRSVRKDTLYSPTQSSTIDLDQAAPFDFHFCQEVLVESWKQHARTCYLKLLSVWSWDLGGFL